MPIMSNPKATAPWSFECDRDLPKSSRPTFLVRGMTDAQLEEHAKLCQEAYDAPTNAEATQKIGEALRVGVVGWKNLATPDGKAVEFDAEQMVELLLRDVQLTDAELWVLVYSYPTAVQMTLAEAFRSPSRAVFGTPTNPGSAPNVAAENASTLPAPEAKPS